MYQISKKKLYNEKNLKRKSYLISDKFYQFNKFEDISLIDRIKFSRIAVMSINGILKEYLRL
jgi:hypothetical protein